MMSSVFEVPTELFDTRTGDDEIVSGQWYFERQELPDDLLPHLAGADNLLVKVYLEHPKCAEYDSEAPFQVELRMWAIDQKLNHKPLVVARRKAAVGHLWTNAQRNEGIRAASGFDYLPSDLTHEDVCDILVRQLLTSVWQKSPKLTIRWDDQGIVVLANLGNSYISTREHQVEE